MREVRKFAPAYEVGSAHPPNAAGGALQALVPFREEKSNVVCVPLHSHLLKMWIFMGSCLSFILDYNLRKQTLQELTRWHKHTVPVGPMKPPKLRVCNLYSRYPETYQNVEPGTGDRVGGGGHLLGSKVHYLFPDILQMAFSDSLGFWGSFIFYAVRRREGCY